MAIHCMAAERGVLMKKRKESSLVKLMAFPTNVGRPKYALGHGDKLNAQSFILSHIDDTLLKTIGCMSIKRCFSLSTS